MRQDFRMGWPPAMLIFEPDPRPSLRTPVPARLSQAEQDARRKLDVEPKKAVAAVLKTTNEIPAGATHQHRENGLFYREASGLRAEYYHAHLKMWRGSCLGNSRLHDENFFDKLLATPKVQHWKGRNSGRFFRAGLLGNAEWFNGDKWLTTTHISNDELDLQPGSFCRTDNLPPTI